MKKCPYCAEEIQDEAIKCRYCGEFLKQKKNIIWGLAAIVIILTLIGIIYINTPSNNAQKASLTRKGEPARIKKTSDNNVSEENKGTVTIDNEKKHKLGVSYDEVMQCLISFFPKMEKIPLNDGRLRYQGQANKNEALATLEIIGNKNNIDEAALILFVPKDAPKIIIGNSTIMTRFLMNLFRNQYENVGDWVSERFDSFQSNPRTFEEEKIFDDKKIKWSIVKEFAMITISIEHR